MGLDKRFLQREGQPLLRWTSERLRPLVDEVVLAVEDATRFADWGLRVVEDYYPGRGVLAGMHAGLMAVRGTWALVVGGDMPLLNAHLIAAMLQLTPTTEADVIVPEWEGQLEPLHALYRPAVCAPAAEAALQRGQRRIIAFYPAVRVYVMPQADVAQYDPAGRSFFNVNTAADWAVVLQELGR